MNGGQIYDRATCLNAIDDNERRIIEAENRVTDLEREIARIEALPGLNNWRPRKLLHLRVKLNNARADLTVFRCIANALVEYIDNN